MKEVALSEVDPVVRKLMIVVHRFHVAPMVSLHVVVSRVVTGREYQMLLCVDRAYRDREFKVVDVAKKQTHVTPILVVMKTRTANVIHAMMMALAPKLCVRKSPRLSVKMALLSHHVAILILIVHKPH